MTEQLPIDSAAKLAMEALKRECWRSMIDTILEWHPRGLDIDGEE